MTENVQHNFTAAQRAQLPKLIDDGQNNNYGEWEIKSFHVLRSWELLKYVEGPDSIAPDIPPLRLNQAYNGMTDENEIATVHIRGNRHEHDLAVEHARPWMTGNNLCLSKIINAVPSTQLHLVKCSIYAQQAWESLKAFYQPGNRLHMATLKSDITTYRCQSNMNIANWLTDMQRLFDTLCGIDPDAMTDDSFALIIVDNMLQDNDTWRTFVSSLCIKIREYETNTLPTPIHSIEFITLIREEFWFRHRNDAQMNVHIFSA
jgi:hypothetical protein